MKNLISLLWTICLTCSALYSQITNEDLLGNWVKYKVEMKDGSRVVDHANTEENFMKLVFFEDRAQLFTDPYYVGTENDYVLEGNIINFDYRSFMVEKVNENELVLIENSHLGLPDDKVKRYYFINEQYLYEVMIKNKDIVFFNEETIVATKYLTPYVNRRFDAYLDIEYYELLNGDLLGYLIISNGGFVADVKITDKKNISEKWELEIIQYLHEYGGTWILPNHEALKKYHYKMEFEMHINSVPVLNSTDHVLTFYSQNLEDHTQDKRNIVTEESMRASQKNFNKGNDFIAKEDFDKAIKYYEKAIKKDSLNFNAFYNRAYSFMQLKNMRSACRDWLYLKNLGQITATNYHEEYCNEAK